MLKLVSEQLFSTKLTINGLWLTDPAIGNVHVRTIKHLFAENTPLLHSILHDRIRQGLLEDHAQVENEGWQSVFLFPTAKRIVGEVNSQVFFGAVLSREREFLDAALQFPDDMGFAGEVLWLCPKILALIIHYLVTRGGKTLKVLWKHLYPLTEGQLARPLGKGSPQQESAPVDCIQTIMYILRHKEPWTSERIVQITLMLFGGSVHQISVALTHALYDLCIYPEYVEPLREEIEEQTKEGWDGAVDRMLLLDSFLKESSRLNTSDTNSIYRKAVKSITFSDGVYVPVNNWIAVPGPTMMRDSTLYPDAESFNGFRFIQHQAMAGNDETNSNAKPSLFTESSASYLLWGLGKRACPGRFYSSALLKLILAHVLLTYDIKLKDEDRHKPRTFRWRSSLIPYSRNRLLFRKRSQTQDQSCCTGE